jgi:acyl-CoA reductase-like NAD-dependent aldehyde dehydrogenase
MVAKQAMKIIYRGAGSRCQMSTGVWVDEEIQDAAVARLTKAVELKPR